MFILVTFGYLASVTFWAMFQIKLAGSMEMVPFRTTPESLSFNVRVLFPLEESKVFTNQLSSILIPCHLLHTPIVALSCEVCSTPGLLLPGVSVRERHRQRPLGLQRCLLTDEYYCV